MKVGLRSGVAALALALFAAGCASTDAASDRRSAGTSGISDTSAEGLSPAMTRYVDATLETPAAAPTDGPGLDDYRARIATLEARIAELRTQETLPDAAMPSLTWNQSGMSVGKKYPIAKSDVADELLIDLGRFSIDLSPQGQESIGRTISMGRISEYMGDDLTERVQIHNPAVRASRQEVQAALQAMPQAAALDAVLQQYQAFARELDTGAGPQRQKGMVAMQFPFPDTTALRSALAALDLRIAEQGLRQTWHETFATLCTALAEHMYLEQAIALNAQSQALLENELKVRQSQLAGNSGGTAVILKAQMSLARLTDMLATLTERRAAVEAQLNALGTGGIAVTREQKIAMGAGHLTSNGMLFYWQKKRQTQTAEATRPPDSETPDTTQSPVSADPTAPFAWRLEGLPAVARARLMLERLQTMREMTVRMATPDPSRGSAYLETGARRNSGTEAEANPSAAPFMLRRDLDPAQAGRYPTQQAYVAELDARIAAAQERLAGAKASASAELRTRFAAMDTALRRVALVRNTLVPQVRQAWDNTLQSYRSGRSDLPALLDAQQRDLDTQLELHAAERDLTSARIRLEELLAAPVNEATREWAEQNVETQAVRDAAAAEFERQRELERTRPKPPLPSDDAINILEKHTP